MLQSKRNTCFQSSLKHDLNFTTLRMLKEEENGWRLDMFVYFLLIFGRFNRLRCVFRTCFSVTVRMTTKTIWKTLVTRRWTWTPCCVRTSETGKRAPSSRRIRNWRTCNTTAPASSRITTLTTTRLTSPRDLNLTRKSETDHHCSVQNLVRLLRIVLKAVVNCNWVTVF